MDDKFVSVIIPNWNGKKFLETCLNSLFRQNYKDFEVIIVDNGSTDGSIDYLKKTYPSVLLKCFNVNKGFSAAINAGIKSARGEYIALLNNDTEVNENWLKELCKALDTNSEVGFCASKMLSYNERDVIDGLGDGYVRGGMAHKFGWAEKDFGQYDVNEFVFGACAGAAIYRRDLFKKIGYFDEDFFAYFEDVDINFRAQLAGFKCLYIPSAIVYHIGSATTGSRFNKTTIYLSTKNYINVLVKNYPTDLFKKNFLQILAIIFITFLKNIIRGRGLSLALAYIKGLTDGFKQMEQMKLKREKIQNNKVVSSEYISNLMLISELKVKTSKRNKKKNT